MLWVIVHVEYPATEESKKEAQTSDDVTLFNNHHRFQFLLIVAVANFRCFRFSCVFCVCSAHQEYLLTLQAKSMQGVLGAGHHARYDGAASTLASQLQALELLNLLAHQHVR